MKIKTSELTRPALDWAVAQCGGIKVRVDTTLSSHPLLVIPGEEDQVDDFYSGYSPSTDWSQGGPIIEREGIDVLKNGGAWVALKTMTSNHGHLRYAGAASLIAAMRCYVASKLGDEVEVPGELLSDGDVIGTDTDGNAICWNAETQQPYNSGEPS